MDPLEMPQADPQPETTSDVDRQDTRRGYLRRLFPEPFWPECKATLKLSWALILVQFIQMALQPVAVIFAGHLGKVELDAVALANSMINVLGNSVVQGLSTACDTIFSQTYGGENKQFLGVQLQRSIVLHCLALCPCFALHLNIEGLLLLVGQDPQVSKLVGRYLLIFMPGLFFLTLYVNLRKYLQCQNIVVPHIVMGLSGLGISAILQYVFVYILDMGLDGSAIAQVLGYFVMLASTLLYLIIWKAYEGTWEGWDIRFLNDWGTFMKLALAGMTMICVEWWAFEITIILAGVLGTTELGAQAVTFNLDSIVFSIILGLSFCTSIRVGQFLGAKKPSKANNAGRVGMALSTVIAGFVIVLYLSMKDILPRIFTSEDDVVKMVSSLIPFLTLWILFDYIAVICRGIVQGCGRQLFGSVVVFICHYVVSLPIGVSLAFLTPLGIFGFWIGLCTALVLCSVVFMVYVIFYIDWDNEVEKAQQRVAVEKHQYLPDRHSETPSEKTPLLGHDVVSNSAEHQYRTGSGRSRDTLMIDESEKTIPTSLIVKRITTTSLMLLILVAGILCRVFIPVVSWTSSATNPQNGSQTEFSTETSDLQRITVTLGV